MSSPPSLPGPVDRSQHEILVVDDNPVTRYSTTRLLRSTGFRTREAGTGQEALARVDEQISAMVLDVHLPDIDGFEVCRILRTKPSFSRLPVLHLSAAYVTDEDKVRGLDSGADAYLTHPVEPAVLVATVQALVRARVAESAMRSSEAKFRALYSQAPSGMCTLDSEGNFTDANPALVTLLRRELNALVGRKLSSFVEPGLAAGFDIDMRNTAGESWRTVCPMIDGQGTVVHVEWRISARLETGDRIGVATDASERVSLEDARREVLQREQEARAEAERVSRIKDDMIAVLSHELRTPLNAILGWTHVLQKRGGTDDLLRGLGVIERNGKTQARLISDILDVSSLNTGKLRLDLKWQDPRELLQASLDTMMPALEQSVHTIDIDAPGVFRGVMVDAARFQQIVWNLVSNAIKFSPKGSVIKVAMHEAGAWLRLTVADAGNGISPGFLPFLFDRFSQGNSATNRSHAGLGLGLSIVRQLVELHGGTVRARSPGVNQGSTFEVDFPAVARPAPVAADAGADPSDTQSTDGDAVSARDLGRELHSLGGIRILAVDDDPEACAMLEVILSDRGAGVRTALAVDQALALHESFVPDVIISDIGMAGSDGYDLLREVRRREGSARRTPAIALTSFSRGKDVADATAAGFDWHLSKPLRPQELIKAVAELAAGLRRPS